jgi:TolB protein
MARLLIIVGYVAVVLTFSASVYPDILTVDAVGPADFTSIQAAIDASSDGDTILVSPGFYSEDIVYGSRAITVTSLDPANPDIINTTIINGAVTFEFLEGPNSVLTGFFIQGEPLKNEKAICTSEYGQSMPSIYEHIIIWIDYRNGNADIYGFDLDSNTEFPICTDIGKQSSISISENTLVYIDSDKYIYGYDLKSKNTFPICVSSSQKSGAVIDGNIVVWMDYRSGNWDIWAYDLINKIEFPICTNSADQRGPAVSGNFVVWADYRSDANGDIYAFDLDTKTEYPICTANNGQYSPAISGNIVVWTDCRNSSLTGIDIYGYDLSSKTEFPICMALSEQSSPSISGSLVVWQDLRSWSSTKCDIYAIDILTKDEFPVCTSPGDQGAPVIYGNYVVWEDQRNSTSSSDIYGAAIQHSFNKGVDNAIICHSAGPSIIANRFGSIANAAIVETVATEQSIFDVF